MSIKRTTMKEVEKNKEDKVYVINPKLILRKDIDRAIIYPKYFPLEEKPFAYYVLHPNQAILLSLFDGKTTLKEVIKKYSWLLNINEDTVRNYVLEFIASNPLFLKK